MEIKRFKFSARTLTGQSPGQFFSIFSKTMTIVEDSEDYYYWAKRLGGLQDVPELPKFHIIKVKGLIPNVIDTKKKECYDHFKHYCIYCVGYFYNRPLQEIYDIDNGKIYNYESKQKVFLNWKSNLEAWGNPILHNIKKAAQ